MNYHDLLDALKKEVEKNRSYVINPQGISNFDDYRFYIGVLYGLNIAIEKLTEQMRISQDD
jgi:hypothetical protein